MANKLSNIYTKTGDGGTTSLVDGSRINKDALRIDVIGEVDELNSVIGVLKASYVSDDIASYLLNIQHGLFDIGGELASPGDAKTHPDWIEDMEEIIETYNNELPPLKEFILPGGNMPGALCHMSRSVCRRLERKLVVLSKNEYVNPNTLSFINRLSDLLFVFARELVLQKGDKEIYWKSDRLKNSL